tara:strand:+ start:33 stop:443 length:411 start_codon:yes stop_codon:yes gene_type:complete
MYPVTQQENIDFSTIDPNWFYKDTYKFPNPVKKAFGDNLFNRNPFKNKINLRNKFKQEFNINIIINDPKLIYSDDYLNIIKHYTITNDLQQYLKQKRNNVRLQICRVMNQYNLPQDLTPTVCAFAVPYSNIYKYMI